MVAARHVSTHLVLHQVQHRCPTPPETYVLPCQHKRTYHKKCEGASSADSLCGWTPSVTTRTLKTAS